MKMNIDKSHFGVKDLMMFTGFSVMDFHSSVQKNKISIGNFNVQSTKYQSAVIPFRISWG